MTKKVRILCVDGGGIRGILPGVFLTQLEAELRSKIAPPKKHRRR